MRVQSIGIFLAVTVLFTVRTTSGANYQFAFDQANYAVSPGETVNVLVYLQETGATAFRDYGLIGAGVTVQFDDASSKVLTTADVVNISEFELLWSKDADPVAGYANLSVGTFGSVYGTEYPEGSDVYRIPLGEFIFTAGEAPNQVTEICATRFDPNLDEIVYIGPGGPVALDSQFQDATATITTIPEPSPMILIGMAAAALLAWRCRRAATMSLAGALLA